MKGLTARQQEIYSFIETFSKTESYNPSFREIGDHFAITVKAVSDHLNAIEKKGFIQREPGSARTLKLKKSEPKHETFAVPILGNVAAGSPLFAAENLDGEIELSSSILYKKGLYFALNVKGESMIEAGICNGDLAVFIQQSTAENGQIVVAMINEGITLKRFFKESSRIRLQPENKTMSPIFTTDAKILGRLVTLVRQYD